MQAVILAGGLGTRLGPLTKTTPKPLVKVAGIPYLEHQLRLLKQQSIRDIALLTGYLGEQISAYFGDGGPWGLSIRYSHESTPLGTGGALRQARPLLHETFLVIYGDSYLPIDYPTVLRRLENSGVKGLIVAYDNRLGKLSVRNNVAVSEDGFVLRYQKDGPDFSCLTHVEAGVLAFRREVLDDIPGAGAASLECEVFPHLIEKKQLIALTTTQRFYDIGTPDRLHLIEELLSNDHHSNAFPD